ncbi:hypothetical protein SAMN05216251_101295 [Actinacidiphila alni]|uniref:Uncharacterized protein n=1 Tax=Actinacidiphila alni TaxID=380248 RepID=A0A1I1XCQ3_9ACTN|nr:DUF6126 family protein [Actinacidiphila alni]SFE04951.1 hypothetical protein SAMN05216251_101295 [Actinacidiphila alni]
MSTPAPSPAPGPAPTPAAGSTPPPAPEQPQPRYSSVVGTTNGSESRKERGVVLRVLMYVVVAHLLAFFIWLLFLVGARG